MGFYSYNCLNCELPILNKWVVQNYENKLNDEDLNLLKSFTKALIIIEDQVFEGIYNGYGKLIDSKSAFNFLKLDEDIIYDFSTEKNIIMYHSELCIIDKEKLNRNKHNKISSTSCDKQGYFIDFNELKLKFKDSNCNHTNIKFEYDRTGIIYLAPDKKNYLLETEDLLNLKFKCLDCKSDFDNYDIDKNGNLLFEKQLILIDKHFKEGIF
jgi:hypothetical protein